MLTPIPAKVRRITPSKQLSSSLVLLFIAVVIFSSPSFAAQLDNRKPGSDTRPDIIHDEERFVERYLDKILGEDPLLLTAEDLADLTSEEYSSSQGFGFILGMGTQNNVLRSSRLKLNSSKSYAAFDYFYSLEDQNENSVLFYTFFENTHFLDIDTEGDEYWFFAMVRGTTQISEASAFGLALKVYNQQGLDELHAEKGLTIPVYKDEDSAIIASWEYFFTKAYATKTMLEYFQRDTRVPEDRFNRLRLTVELTKHSGDTAGIMITYQGDKSLYPEDEVLDLDGYRVEGTTLEIESHRVTASNNHSWQESGNVYLNTGLAVSSQTDNGPGYYNYNGLHLDQSLQLKQQQWKFKEKIEWAHRTYNERLINTSSGNKENLYRTTYEIALSAEKQISSRINILAEIDSTNVESNDPDEEYVSNSALLSMVVSF